ncbi:MAG: exosortase/archaeosortase family protein [Proteobacteria bacterium]|nr:exosortase/archaeosortase family protein [Pseudomonadota bacterium]
MREAGEENAMKPSEFAWIAALGLAFAPALAAMAGVWREVDYASHGFLVPLVAAWAAFAQLPALRRLPVESSSWGRGVIAASLLVYAAGLAATQVTLQGVALVGAVAGTVLVLRGGPWLRALAFPVGYLLFMVPLPESWVAPVIVALRLFVTQVGVAVLGALGTPVAQTGNILELPGGETLFVAEACSGITSVLTLLPIGVFVAYATERRLARRLVLVAAVVPLAMLGNLLRVVASVWLALVYGAGFATTGLVHTVAGLLTYVLGVAALLLLSSGLQRVWPKPPERAAPA